VGPAGQALPHPITGGPFTSPVPPGSGWPGDPATSRTPRAGTAADVLRLAERATLAQVDARSSVCSACPRLVTWREDVARTKRRAFADQPYWGRPAASFGDPEATLLIVGLAPAAHGANRTGRMFTGDRSGDWIFAALHRAGYATQGTSVAAGDGLELHGARMVATVRCAPPDNKPTPDEKHACAPWLHRELDLLSDGLTAILALGGIAWQATFAALSDLGWGIPRPRPRFGHGVIAPVTTPAPVATTAAAARATRSGREGGGGRELAVVGSYHVSQQNTFTGRLTEQMLDDVLARCRDGLGGAQSHTAGGVHPL
jgi:uracil-DNA glycosylase family 4